MRLDTSGCLPDVHFEGRILAVLIIISLMELRESTAEIVVQPGRWAPKPGCHRIGYSRTHSKVGCEERNITTNVCRGFCLSFTIPSSPQVLQANRNHFFSSYSLCCRMTDYELVEFPFKCTNGIRIFRIRSATQCECFDCLSGT